MGKLIKVDRISQQRSKKGIEQPLPMTSLGYSEIEGENGATSPVSLQSTSFSKDVNFVENSSEGSTWLPNANPKNLFFNEPNRVKASILPSIHPPIHSRQHHRRKRQHFSTKRKKSFVHTLNHDEEHQFDADAEDSDSTPEMKTPGTSKTSTMSYGSAEKYSMKLDQNDLVTPPRRFINSSQFIECSPLSSSFDTVSSSSISGDSTPHENKRRKSECLKGKKQEYMKKISLGICSFNPFREVMIGLEKKLDTKWKSKNKTKQPIEDLDGYNKRESVQTSKQKMNPSFRITREMIFRLSVIIFVYSITTVVMTTTKLLQIQTDDIDVQLKRFKSNKIHTNDPVLAFNYENQSTYQISFFQGNSKVMIKRTLGGLRSIKRFEAKDQKLDKPTRLRSLGFGHLDIQMYNTKQNVVSPKSKRSRIFHFHQSTSTVSQSRIVRELSLYPTIFSDSTQLYGIRDSADPALSKMESIIEDENAECVPMAEWQSTYHPTCNSIHELDLGYIDGITLVGKKGYWRNAWRVDFDSSQHIETMILKTPRFDHNFERDYYEHDRVDAQAMERQTFSPHVINIYGFCGRSVTSEFADGPRLGTLIDKSRKYPLKRLEIARDIAVGLSHVHFGRSEENASFVHLDVNPANIVVVDNTLKLNDFNIGIMLKRNTTSGLPCAFPAQYPNAQWRSPEEANDSLHLNEKVDVFSMGHIFFRMICGHEPWNKLEVGGKPSSTTLKEKVKRGILPRIPDYITNTTIVEERVILDAMLASYTLNPDERPSSRDIAKFLDYQFANLSRDAKLKSQE